MRCEVSNIFCCLQISLLQLGRQQHRQFYRQHHQLNLQLDRHHIIRPARVFLPRVGRILVAHTPHSSYPILYPPIHIISHHYLTLLSNSVIIAMFCYQLSLVCLNERRISHFVLIFTTIDIDKFCFILEYLSN